LRENRPAAASRKCTTHDIRGGGRWSDARKSIGIDEVLRTADRILLLAS
jgi:hypothetical protein